MTNSDNLFYSARVFERERSEITDRYEKRMAELEPMRGSEYFTSEAAAAAEAKDEALSQLQKDYWRKFHDCVSEMRNVNGKRAVKAPSAEELNVLTVVKMRENITMHELDEIARTLSGNMMCLGIIQEVAHKHGITRNYLSFYSGGDVPVETVDRALDALESGLRDFVQHDTIRAARTYQEFHDRKYGVDPNAAPLPKRKPLINKGDLYRKYGGLADDELGAFYAAVDG